MEPHGVCFNWGFLFDSMTIRLRQELAADIPHTLDKGRLRVRAEFARSVVTTNRPGQIYLTGQGLIAADPFQWVRIRASMLQPPVKLNISFRHGYLSFIEYLVNWNLSFEQNYFSRSWPSCLRHLSALPARPWLLESGHQGQGTTGFLGLVTMPSLRWVPCGTASVFPGLALTLRTLYYSKLFASPPSTKTYVKFHRWLYIVVSLMCW